MRYLKYLVSASLLFSSTLAVANCSDEDPHTGFCWDDYNHCVSQCKQDHDDDDFKFGLCKKKCEIEYGPKLLGFSSNISLPKKS